MVSGYERSPDYGDPEPLGWGSALVVVGYFAIIAWMLWQAL